MLLCRLRSPLATAKRVCYRALSDAAKIQRLYLRPDGTDNMQAQQRAGFHKIARILATLAALMLSARLSRAGDWPQILGPARNGVAATDEKIVDAFPKGGPRTVWEHKVGQGYAGVAVADGRLVVFHRVGDQEIVEALDPETAKPIWKVSFPTSYSSGIDPDKGPRCVPLIHDGSVYVFGVGGELRGLDLRSGAQRWWQETKREFKVPESYFGVGSTPIIEKDLLLANVGGKSGHGIVAFSLADGSTRWHSLDDTASYSSPTAVTLAGVRHVIFVTRLNALSIDPETGKVHWQFRFGAPGPTVNAASPQIVDDYLFLSASYGVGAVCRKIGKTSAPEVWANNSTMSSQFNTSVPSGPSLFGVDGRRDGPPGSLRCFDPKTGEVRWSEENFGAANLIAADGKLVIVTDGGELVLAEASSEKYHELGRVKLSSSTTRALPALSQGRLYVRDTSTLKCIDLRRTK